MDRSLVAVLFVAVAASSVSPAATGAPSNQSPAARLSEPDAPLTSETAFLMAAETAVNIGDMDSAIQLYQSAIIYAPGDPVPYERLAEFYVQGGQSELAQRFFALALDVQPAYAPALRGIALLDLAAGDRAGAQAQHEVLLRACGAACPETAQVEKALNPNAKP
jgi:Flp pilus assembly protein TadD